MAGWEHMSLGNSDWMPHNSGEQQQQEEEEEEEEEEDKEH